MVGQVTVNGISRPLRATTYYYPQSVDQTNVEQMNFDRVSLLSRAFADWAARGY
jgi:hypothetical protein